MESMIGYLSTNIVIYIAGFFVGRFGKLDVVFGVTVPRDINDEGQIDDFRKDFKRIYGITAGIILVAIVVANLYLENLHWLFDAYVFIWFVLTVYLYIVFHKKVKVIVRENKEDALKTTTTPKKRVVSASLDNRDNEVKRIYKYFIPSGILIAITVIMTIVFYDNISPLIPMHYNLLGEVDQVADKSFFSVYGIIMIEVFVILMLYLTCLMSVKYSRRRIDPRKPETSRLQLKIANRRIVQYISVMSFLLCLMFGVLHLGVFENINLSANVLWLASFGPTIIILLGLIFYFVTTGIYGDRVKVDIDEVEKDVEPGMDEDEGWILGLFYYNKKDTSIFVSKRFGGGFTVNLATLGGKMFLIMIVVLVVGSLVLAFS